MKLHLGCGSRIIPGFENLDGDPTLGALKWWAPKLPYAKDSVEFIYSEHFIEHLDKATAIKLLAECHYVLKKGGKIRLITPDIETILSDLSEPGRSNREVFRTKYSQVGWQPQTRSDFLNEAMRSWGHQYLWSRFDLFDHLRKSFPEADVQYGVYDSSFDSRPDYGDCIMEVTKH